MEQKRLYFQSWAKVLEYIWSKNTGNLFLVCLKKMDFKILNQYFDHQVPLDFMFIQIQVGKGTKSLTNSSDGFTNFVNTNVRILSTKVTLISTEEYLNKQTQFSKNLQVRRYKKFVSCEFHFFRETHLVHQMIEAPNLESTNPELYSRKFFNRKN